MKRLGLQSSLYNGLQLKDEIYTAKHHNISTFDIFFDTVWVMTGPNEKDAIVIKRAAIGINFV